MQRILIILFFLCACDEPSCPIYEFQHDEVPAPAPIGWGDLVQGHGDLLLLTGGYEAVQCNIVGLDGAIGDRTCQVTAFDVSVAYAEAVQAAIDPRRGVLETVDGLRIITENHAIDVDLARSVATVATLQASVAGSYFLVESVYAGPAPTLVVWSSITAEPNVRTAGVGRLVGTTIEPVGEPFFTGSVRESSGAIGIDGGRDPVSGQLWLASPDGVHVLEFASDGALVGMFEHGAAVAPGGQWMPLPTGRWVSLDPTICTFDPPNLADRECFPLTLEPPPQGDGQFLAAHVLPTGDVIMAWRFQLQDPAADPGTGESVFVGTWDGANLVRGRTTNYVLNECTSTAPPIMPF